MQAKQARRGVPVIQFHEKAVLRIVERYIESRDSLEEPIAIACALSAIRTALPLAPLSDRQLIDLITSSAVGKGRIVSFDMRPDAR